MTEFLLALLDERGENLLVESTDTEIASEIAADLRELLGDPEGLACARPQTMTLPNERILSSEVTVRISGIYHDSLIEGPGRRSVVRVQGCPIRCVGCYVPDTWDASGGQDVSITAVADALLDARPEGVTILGGEPFAQPEALAALIDELLGRQPDLHILCYSGFTLEALRRRQNEHIDYVLDEIDMLIDGKYVQALSGGAGPWTGSGNQRVIDMPATRACGEVVPWTE